MTPDEFAERALLGVLVRDPNRFREVGPQLDGGDFSGLRERGLFTVLREHHGQVGPHARVTGGYQANEWARALLAAWPELARYEIDAAYLAEVMATAPPSGGQPAVYAELVMEASIRRDITALGYEAARLSAQTPQVAELLAAQETITAHLASAQQRWEAITQTRDLARALTPEPSTGGSIDRDLFGRPVLPTPARPTPSADDVHAAQEQVIGAILRHPGVADALLGRFEPADFLDPELGNALDAAKRVHVQAASTGRQVDPVTVTWALQTLPHERGRIPGPEYLHDLATTAEPNDLDSAVDLVMRSSLATLTAQAAATAQQAARQAGAAPQDVLATARSSYQAVDAAARRLTGRTSTDYQLSVLDNRATTDSSPTMADLTGVRSRSAALLQQTTATRSGPHTEHPGIGARLNALDSPTAGQEVHSDAGPRLA